MPTYFGRLSTTSFIEAAIQKSTISSYIWIITKQGPSKATDFSKSALFIMHQYEERVSSGKVLFKDKVGA